jgi:hypothetical protein
MRIRYPGADVERGEPGNSEVLYPDRARADEG